MAKSPFKYFAEEKRPEIMKQNPDLSFADITNMIKEMWDKLSDEEKKPYRVKAEAVNETRSMMKQHTISKMGAARKTVYDPSMLKAIKEALKKQKE